MSPALAEDKKEDKKTDKENTKNQDKSQDPEDEEYANYENESEADSSFHSISKYNFLFYMVYKVKYGDIDPVSESKPAIAEE
ncbi:MAG: hypothetical protein AAGC88_07625 [Bacteroidota bacterium]